MKVRAIVVPQCMSNKIYLTEIDSDSADIIYNILKCSNFDFVSLYRSNTHSLDAFIKDSNNSNCLQVNEYFTIPFAMNILPSNINGSAVLSLTDRYGNTVDLNPNEIKSLLITKFKFKDRFFNF